LKINAIIHPLVRAEMKQRYRTIVEKDPHALVLHDVPLLIEVGLYKKMDCVILVYLDHDTQLQRIMHRDGISTTEAKRLLTIQMPLEEKKQYANYIIDNSGTRDNTKKQVVKLLHTLHA
jgi:dephospho-CoA kinase